jgi:hypothetical protein
MTGRPINPMARGNHALYRENEVNHCPGCGRTHWHIGRVTAECAFCGTALPLDVSDNTEAPRMRCFGRGGGRVRRMMAFA